jgi:hypothetical protein
MAWCLSRCSTLVLVRPFVIGNRAIDHWISRFISLHFKPSGFVSRCSCNALKTVLRLAAEIVISRNLRRAGKPSYREVLQVPTSFVRDATPQNSGRSSRIRTETNSFEQVDW